jgi:stringent starvation protein B
MPPAAPPPPPKRPYLLRAMHQWMSDSGHTPHVIVDAERAGAEVPRAYVKEGKIVLNLSPSATQRLKLGNDEIEFDARFAGVVHHVRFPVAAVMGIYARETGEGMVFSESDLGPEPPKPPATTEEGGNTPPSGGTRPRPQLKVVK